MKKIISILLMLSLAAVSISAKTIPANNQTIIKTPEEAAKGLYKAWISRSRRTADKFARTEAVDKLFGVNRHTMTFKGCHKREEGDFECIYKNQKLDLSFAMIVKIFRAGYRVTSVSFSSEAV